MQLLHLTYGIDLCANYASIRSKKKKKVINNLKFFILPGFAKTKQIILFFFTHNIHEKLQTSNFFHQQGQQEKRLKIEIFVFYNKQEQNKQQTK